MKLGTYTTIALATAALSVFAVGCDDDDDSTPSTTASGTRTGTGAGTGGSAGMGGSGGSAGMGGMGGGGGGEATGRVRVGHLSPDAPPVDFCVDPGSGFIGPVMASLSDTDGLAYTEVTDYLELPAATYAVRLVAPNASDCDTPLGPADTTGIVLPEDVDATIAAIGMLTPAGEDEAFELTVYVDDNADPATGKAHLRFIHASPDTPGVDVGTGSEETSDFSAIWDNVPYPEVGLVGGQPYLETDPLSGVTISAQANDAGVDALVISGVNLPEGAIATAYAIGNLDADPQDLKVLLCVDNAAPVSCSVVP